MIRRRRWPGRRQQNKYVRMTSNILGSAGVLNDAICFLLAFFATSVTYRFILHYYYNHRLALSSAIVMAINFFLIRISRDAYSVHRGQQGDLGSSTVIDYAVALILFAFVIVQFGIGRELSIGFLLSYLSLSLLLLLSSRVVFRKITHHMMRAGIIGQRVAVYGTDRETNEKVLELLAIEHLPHVKVIGFADERRARVDSAPIGTIPYLGDIGQLLELSKKGKLDQLIIALPLVHQERLDEMIEKLSAGAIDICVIPREFIVLRNRYRVAYLGGMPVLNVWQLPLRDFEGLLKEIQDRLLALAGLVLLSPLLVLTAVAIKLESKGPILFKQKRFGFNNQAINVLKFRSMYVDRQDVTGSERTQKGDPRVTRVGRVIRRLSIDELPQLINVLRGEMSIVGPRPHATQMRVVGAYYHDAVRGYAARHRVKPGITGLAQVRGLRGEIDTMERAKKRVEYDTYYIEHWSPLLDLRIIMETLVKLVWDRHAY